MAETRRFDVAIIGAGIAGSALATSLSNSGLSIALVERHPLTAPELPCAIELDAFDNRVSAITPRSRSLLEQLGAWQAIEDYRQCTYKHMTVWDAEGTGSIEFDCGEVDARALGHIVENRAIVSALLERVRVAADIQVLDGAGLAECQREGPEGGVRVRLDDGSELMVDLLVAADGALSRVREMMAFETREWDYGHRAIVSTVRVQQPHGATCWQRFLPTGPLAFLPLPGTQEQHYCSVVWSLKEALVDEQLAMTEPDFCQSLERAFESRLGHVMASAPRFAFPLRQRHAVDYVQQGIALVADAAHTIHPLAGQGINLGLQDVAVLSEEILAGQAKGRKPGELELLKRYQRRRKGENLLMMAAMDGFKRLFEQESLPLRWLRNAGMRGVGQLRPVKQQLIRHAMGVG